MIRLLICPVCEALFCVTKGDRKHCSADCFSRVKLKAQPDKE